ncbi:hypothetical protein ABTM49_19345, partial [Acinetobacter baumannii]
DANKQKLKIKSCVMLVSLNLKRLPVRENFILFHTRLEYNCDQLQSVGAFCKRSVNFLII